MSDSNEEVYWEFWSTRAPSFHIGNPALDTELRHFTNFWMLFEAKCFDCEFDQAIIGKKCRDWVAVGIDPHDFFAAQVNYFQNRYHSGAGAERKKKALLGRRKLNKKNLRSFENFVSGQSTSKSEVLQGLICVIYRYRNNFFHGEKLNMGLDEQIENLRQANAVLMGIMTALISPTDD